MIESQGKKEYIYYSKAKIYGNEKSEKKNVFCFLYSVFCILYSVFIAHYQSYSQTWNYTTEFAGPNPNRKGSIAFKINDKVYMGFGQSGDFTYHSDLYEYNPNNNTWVFKTNFPGGNRFIPVVFVINGKAYIGLGSNYSGYDGGQSDLWEFTPESNTWIRKADFPGTRYGAATFVIDGKGYMVAGYGLPIDGVETGSRRDCWQYDPQLNLWAKKADLPVVDEEVDPNGWYARRWDATGFSVNGKGYVGGGYNLFSLGVRTDFWEYDPTANAWTQMGFFPQPQGGNGLLQATATEICGKVYIGLGLTNPTGATATKNTEFWVYDPITNAFTSIPSFGGGTNFLPSGVSFHHNGKLYAGNPSMYAYEIFAVSGNSIVCTTGTLFTLNNTPSGSIISWQATPSNLFAVSSGTGGSANLMAVNSSVAGQGTITFSIGTPCSGTPVKVSKAVWVGSPTVSFVEKKCYGTEAIFRYRATQISGASYTWSINNPNLNLTTYDYESIVSGIPGGSPQSFVLTVQIQQGSCAVVKSRSGSYSDCPGGGPRLNVYPNPASSELIVSFQADSIAGGDYLLGETVQLELTNGRQERVYFRKTKNSRTVIAVDKLPIGSYYLSIISRNEIIQKQIIISR